METILGLTLFGSGWILATLSIIYFIWVIVGEVKENYAHVVAPSIVFGALLFFKSNIVLNITFLGVLKFIIPYLILALLYTFLRAYLKGKELKTLHDKKMFNLKEHVAIWFIFFPTSLLVWVFRKGLMRLVNGIYDIFDKFYMKLFMQDTQKESDLIVNTVLEIMYKEPLVHMSKTGLSELYDKNPQLKGIFPYYHNFKDYVMGTERFKGEMCILLDDFADKFHKPDNNKTIRPFYDENRLDKYFAFDDFKDAVKGTRPSDLY